MKLKITKEFTFDAAHHLTKYYGKCENVHGHTYRLLVTLNGEVQPNGMVIDFIIFKRIVTKHILDFLDHKDLNTIFENPTAENILLWIWNKLSNIEQLLAEELNDPNLDEEIKKYLQDKNSSLDKSTSASHISLDQVTLYETATSSATITC